MNELASSAGLGGAMSLVWNCWPAFGAVVDDVYVLVLKVFLLVVIIRI